jgi:hypothetical protein
MVFAEVQLFRGHGESLGVDIGVLDRSAQPALVVHGVAAGGVAQRAGLRIGDRILAINEVPVATLDFHAVVMPVLRTAPRVALRLLRTAEAVWSSSAPEQPPPPLPAGGPALLPSHSSSVIPATGPALLLAAFGASHRTSLRAVEASEQAPRSAASAAAAPSLPPPPQQPPPPPPLLPAAAEAASAAERERAGSSRTHSVGDRGSLDFFGPKHAAKASLVPGQRKASAARARKGSKPMLAHTDDFSIGGEDVYGGALLK